MRTLQAAMLCLGGLCACDGSPGEARLEVFEPASAELRWRATVPSQQFSVEAPHGVENLLRVFTSDDCWDANYTMDFELSSGALRRKVRSQPREGVGGPATDPRNPRQCAPGFVAQSVQLSTNETVYICGYTEDGVLTAYSSRDDSERLRLSPSGTPNPIVTGDLLLLHVVEPEGLEAHSLVTGEPVWSWTAPESYTYQGADLERAYLLTEASGEGYSLSLADGTLVWQNDLGCDSLSLAGDALVCHQTLRDSSCEQE